MSSVGEDRTVAFARRLRSPLGQLQLIAATLVAAVILAVIAASHRAFFEGYVREKYPTPGPAAVELANGIQRGTADPQSLALQPDATFADLYHLWMTTTDPSVYSRLPAATVGSRPELLGERVERTLVAGTREQRRRAAGFAAASRSARLLPPLHRARKRAETVGDAELESALARAIGDLEPSAEADPNGARGLEPTRETR